MKHLWITLTLLVGSSYFLQGQIKEFQNALISRGEVSYFLNQKDSIYAVCNYGGIYKSTDFGKSWAYASNGIDKFSNLTRDVAIWNDTLWTMLQANTYRDVYFRFSADGGSSWQTDQSGVSGFPNRPFEILSYNVASNKMYLALRLHNIYGASADTIAIYYSSNGYKWNHGTDIQSDWGKFLHISNKYLFFYSDKNGAFDTLIYTSNGTSYQGINMGSLNRGDMYDEVFTAEPNGDYLYVANSGSPHRYDLINHTWTKIHNNAIPLTEFVDGISATDNVLLTYSFSFVPTFNVKSYRSTDHGKTWSAFKTTGNIALPIPRCAISLNDSFVVCNTQLDQMIYSSNKGSNFSLSTKGFYNLNSGLVNVIDSILLIPTPVLGVTRSGDSGQTWSYANKGIYQPLPNTWFTRTMFKHGNSLYLTAEAGIDADSHYLYKSNDLGRSWQRQYNYPSYERMNYMGSRGNIFYMRFVNSENDGNSDWDTACAIYANTSGTWTKISDDFFLSNKMNLRRVHSVGGYGSTTYLFGSKKNYTDVIYSWTSSTGWNIFYTTQGTGNPGLKRKYYDDYSGLFGECIYDFDMQGKMLVVMNDGNKDVLYGMSYAGSSLAPISTTGLDTNMQITSLAYLNNFWYMGTSIGLYGSLNGLSWKLISPKFMHGMNINTIKAMGDKIILGTVGNGLYYLDHTKINLGNDLEICSGDSVVLKAQSANTVNWCCQLGTGNPIKFLPKTNMTITASSNDVFGFTRKDTMQLTVNPLPNADFTINDPIQCYSNNNFMFSATYKNFIKYLWDFGDGTTSTKLEPDHSYAQPSDSFSVQLKVISDKGCEDSISKYVYFDQAPAAPIYAAGDTSICDGDSVSLYTDAGQDIDFEWFKDQSAIPDSKHPYYVTTQSGNFQIRVSSTKSGCYNDSRPIKITVNNTNFNPNFSASPRTPSWNTGTQQFDAVAFTNLTLNPSNFNFNWLFGDGTTSTDSDPFHNYKFNGDYTISLTAEHKTTGCRDTFSKIDYIKCQGGSVNPCPLSVKLEYSGAPIICENDRFLVTAKITGNPLSILWTHNGTVLSEEENTTLWAKDKGEYRIIISDTSCSVTSYPFYLSHYPVVKPTIKAEGSIRPCTNDSIKLFVTTYYTSYEWSTGEKAASIYVKNSGEYYAYASDIHGCISRSDPFTVNASFLTAPEICMVTVDSSGEHNMVIWERPKSKLIQGYNVYKETTEAGIYDKIAYLPYDSLSVYVDQNSNPRKRANRYKLTLVDTCNIESQPGNHHKTIHLTASNGTSGEKNLLWSPYEGFSFKSYYIYSGNTPANISLIDSIPSNLNSYSDINAPKGLVFYQLGIKKDGLCSPALFRAQTSSGPFSQSLSNIKDYGQITPNYLVAKPDSFFVDTSGGKFNIRIFTNAKTWSAQQPENWLSITPDLVNGELLVNVDPNTNSDIRISKITVSADDADDISLFVVQYGATSALPEYEQARIFVYPNPATNIINLISTQPGKPYSAMLYSIEGKFLGSYPNISTKLYQLNVDQLAKGMYYLKISGSSNQTIKFIKE